MKNKLTVSKVTSYILLVTLVFAVIYSVVAIIVSPSEVQEGGEYTNVKADYVLMLLQCLLGLAAMLLPSILTHKFNLIIPSYMMVLYTVFLYCAIYLGEVRNFFYLVPKWDLILHTFSGAMLGALGFSVINILNNTERIPVNLSPLFVAVFTFCFAVSLGALWEIYEFAIDGIFKQNMQKFAYESGELMAGREALADTMWDLIVDSCGAFVMASIGFVSLKFKKGWVEKLQLKRKRRGNSCADGKEN